jgi:predicted amidophosphoribosyltransferase
MSTTSHRIDHQQHTIEAMLHIDCRHHHEAGGTLCSDCNRLLDYARRRLASCPFQEAKPAFNHCQVHCYSKAMRERVRSVMRFAGPRMLLRHPLLSLWHMLDNRRRPPPLPRHEAKSSAD